MMLVANECWWIRQQIGHEEITSLEEMDELGFERSALHDPEGSEYSAGLDDGSYTLESDYYN